MMRSLKIDTMSGFPKSLVRGKHKPRWSMALTIWQLSRNTMEKRGRESETEEGAVQQ